MFESQVTLISMAKYGRNAGCYSQILQHMTQAVAQQTHSTPQLPTCSSFWQLSGHQPVSRGCQKHRALSLLFFALAGRWGTRCLTATQERKLAGNLFVSAFLLISLHGVGNGNSRSRAPSRPRTCRQLYNRHFLPLLGGSPEIPD